MEYGKIPSHYTVKLRRFNGYFLQCRYSLMFVYQDVILGNIKFPADAKTFVGGSVVRLVNPCTKCVPIVQQDRSGRQAEQC